MYGLGASLQTNVYSQEERNRNGKEKNNNTVTASTQGQPQTWQPTQPSTSGYFIPVDVMGTKGGDKQDNPQQGINPPRNHDVKECLRDILKRKKPGIKPDKKPIKQETLTPQEQEKRRLRRERNKLAAQGYRERKKEKVYELEKEATGLKQSNKGLEKEIQALKEEKESLKKSLTNHDCKLANEPMVNSEGNNPQNSPSRLLTPRTMMEIITNPNNLLTPTTVRNIMDGTENPFFPPS